VTAMMTSLSPSGPCVAGLAVGVDPTAGRIVLTGELDRSTCDQLARVARALTTSAAPNWVVDLAGVTFCDAPGLRALAGLRRDAEDSGATMTLVGARPFLVRLLGLADSVGLLAPDRCAAAGRQPGRVRDAAVRT
jgi:anti-anti-sigma factor